MPRPAARSRIRTCLSKVVKAYPPGACQLQRWYSRSAAQGDALLDGSALVETRSQDVTTLDEAGRFRDAHSVQAYLWLAPNENSFGGQRRLGAITRQGNPGACVALVQPDCDCLGSRANARNPSQQAPCAR